MSPEIVLKDPDEVRACTFDWTRGLNAGATITGTNTWTVTPAGPTISGQSIVLGGLKTTALISGGTAGVTYVVTNRIGTSDGETLEESGKLRVRVSG